MIPTILICASISHLRVAYPPLVSVMGVSFGYEGYDTLYENLDFGLDMDTLAHIAGPNGQVRVRF